MASQRKIILVTRRTRLQELVFKHNTEEQAEFYIQSRGEDFSDYRQEHQSYRNALNAIETALSALGRVQTLDRDFLANFIFAQDDIVVVLGQDGLVANTLKYLSGQPTVAINPDPSRFDGVLLPFQVKESAKVLTDVLRGKFNYKSITMAQAELNDGQKMVAVNDFFIGQRGHASARYHLLQSGEGEFQSSSGIIVSTGLGSTGWLKSVITGSFGIAQANGWTDDRQIPLSNFGWDEARLVYSVREPFPSRNTGTRMLFGQVSDSAPLTIASAMPENGVIFSDGMLDDCIEFNAGAVVNIALRPVQGQLVC